MPGFDRAVSPPADAADNYSARMRRKPDHITGPDFLDRATPTLRPPESGCDNQRLTEGMGVPGGAGTRLKRDVCVPNTCRFGCLEQRINANCAGKPIGLSFAGRL